MRFHRVLLASCFAIANVLMSLSISWSTSAEGDRCSNARTAYDRGVKLLKYEERRTAFQEAVDLCPTYGEAHVNLADAYENLALLGAPRDEASLTKSNQLLNKAVDHYKKAAELNGNLFPAHIGLAGIYAQQGRYALSANACRTALKLRPHDETAQTILANVEKKQNAETRGIKKSEQIRQEAKQATLGSAFQTMGFQRFTVRDRQSFHNILFEGWSARIADGDPTRQLNEIGQALSSPDFAAQRFVVEGHTNTVGGYEENEKLSWERARSVKHYLVSKYSIDPERLLTQGLGYTRLKYPDRPTDEKNRRVEILFVE